jgi:hypothetical protein
MASKIDISSLTLNPIEESDLGNFVIERTFNDPMLNSIHAVWTGIKMKEQIVFASQLGLTGVLDAACDRPVSGAASVMTEKFWEPADIGDTLVHCQKDVDALFKAYYTKIERYVQKFDIQGSDLENFLKVLLDEAVMRSIWRIAWYADTSVAASGAAASGLIVAGNVKFFDQIDGLWNQIFAGVTATDIPYSNEKIGALNALTDTATQVVLAAGDSVALFNDMWTKADTRLLDDASKQFLVTREIWENYRQYLQTNSLNFTVEFTTDGFPTLEWNGAKVVNMSTVWDLFGRTYFEQDSTNNAYDLPNRAVLTVPANIPIGTLNESDWDAEDPFYEKKERQLYMPYGYTLDSKVLEPYMMVAAY